MFLPSPNKPSRNPVGLLLVLVLMASLLGVARTVGAQTPPATPSPAPSPTPAAPTPTPAPADFLSFVSDELLNPTGVYKERLSQSSLFAHMQQVRPRNFAETRNSGVA